MAAIRHPRKAAVRRTPLRLLPLCLAVSAAVHAEETPGGDWRLCRAPETLPLFTEVQPQAAAMRADAATDIEADALDVKERERTVFTGDVRMTHADQYLATDKVVFKHDTESFQTEGPVRYQDAKLRLTAGSASGTQKGDKLDLSQVVYQFNAQNGNGRAATASMSGEVGTLTQATYSTCPPGQRQWEFAASRISINDATKRGVAHNVTLRMGKVPVLWLPWISFPTDNERKSGVLAPTIGRDDRNGLDFKLPVYLNLAPNYDATLTPRWLSKRGLMLGGEFRYLTGSSFGSFTGTFLPNDDLTHADRSFVSFHDYSRLNRHWFFSTHLNNVSYRNYFSVFGDGIASTSIWMLACVLGFFGRGKYWSASLTAESWQIASPLLQDGDEPYRRLPRLQASAARPLSRWFEAGLELEALRFDHDALDPYDPINAFRFDGGSRLDLRPWLRARLGGGSWYVTPQLAWRYTRYESLDGVPVDLFGAPRSATRSLPILSVDAGANFEREFAWRGGDYIQTLEPRLYYLRVPFREQEDLPVFDTRELTFAWNALFRDNRFGGADRQSDANQLALALTTRVLRGDDGSERLSAGIGRIHYFDRPRVTLPGDPPPGGSGSAWIATVGLSVSDWWNVGLTHQWDPEDRRTDLSSVHTQLRLHQGTIVNAAYRYRRRTDTLPPLEQTDLSFVIPVDRNWNLYGRWNYSLHDNQTIEALAGFEWKSCCVAVRLLGRQYIRSFDSRQNLGLYLEIELNGLGSFGRDTVRLLDNAILGYAH
jgi:LPS-assembly protein